MNMFDKEKWAAILKKAQGDLSLNKFAQLTGVNKASLSNYINCISQHRPEFKTIEKLNDACPDISITQFLLAAGYDKFVPGAGDVDALAHGINNMLIEQGVIDPRNPIDVEERDHIIKFLKKCIELKSDV